MADDGRRSRPVRSSRGKRVQNKGLQRMRELKEMGISRLEQHESDDEELFETYNDQEYQELVRKQREMGDFVVDDDGTGYLDDNDLEYDPKRRRDEDEIGGDDDDGDDEQNKHKKKKKDKIKPEHKLSAMFKRQAEMNAKKGSTGERQVDEEAAAALAKDSQLGDMLKKLVAAPVVKRERPAHLAARRGARSKKRQRRRRALADEGIWDTEPDATAPLGGVYGDDPNEGAGMDFDDAPPPVDDDDTPMANGSNADEAGDPSATDDCNATAKQADAAATTNKRSRLLEMARKRAVRETAAPPAPPPPATARNLQGAAPVGMLSDGDVGGSGWNAAATGAEEAGASSVGGNGAGVGGNGAAASSGSGLKLERDEEGEEFLQFFWLDMYEDPRNAPGQVFVFGKVWSEAKREFESCTLVVPNIERVLYVLPRDVRKDDGEEVTVQMVYSEVRQMLNGLLPENARAFKCKPVQRNYAFELSGVPREEAQYLKVKYPMAAERKGQLDQDRSGTTFSRLFGARQSAIERLVISRDLMGPGWLRIAAPKPVSGPSVSWARHEFSLSGPKAIEKCTDAPPPPPPLKVMSLSLKTVVNHATHAHEVVMASALIRDGVMLDGFTPAHDSPKGVKHFTALRAPGKSAGAGAAMQLPPDLKPRVGADPKLRGTVTLQYNERSLLNFLVAQIHRHDPDVLMGHNICGFELDVLLARMQANKISQWSKIGRLKRTRVPRSRAGAGGRETFTGVLTPGRMLLDTYLTARELLYGQRNFTLTELCRTQLKVKRAEVDPIDVPLYFSKSEDVLRLKQNSETDAWLTLQLSFKLEALPLTMQLTNLGGNLWRRTLSGGRAERIEYLLLHEFHRRKYVLPDKAQWEPKKKKAQSRSQKRKPKYAGGLVLDPKKGLYDKFILLLDFNSLYPSIIQEYNLCFTTVVRPAIDDDEAAAIAEEQAQTAGDGDDAGGAAITEADFELPQLPDRDVHKDLAVLPTLIRTLVQRRKVVKGMIKKERDLAKLAQLDVRQKALKITANSMYGCLGFSNSRFFAKPIAAIVTSQGREILQNTVDLAQDKLGLEVIYGDTDSIMINTGTTDLTKVKEIGQLVKREVNKLYRLLEIEQDGIFKTMLLLKKKKYAALVISEKRGKDGSVTIETTKETKGLDLVRRDWCPLSKVTGNAVLDHILSGKPCDEVVEGIHAVCAELGERIKADKVPLEQYIITKGLNKSPKDYPDAKGQPHLQVALAMLRQGKAVNTGDHIPYVICTTTREAHEKAVAALTTGATEDTEAKTTSKATTSKAGSSKQSAGRAFHPDEVYKSRGTLKPDKEWYLSQQVLPPVQRLCEPIDGTSPPQIAEQLGLDPSKHRGRVAYGDDDDFKYTFASEIDESERFKRCDPVKVQCPVCSTTFALPGPYWTPEMFAAAATSAAQIKDGAADETAKAKPEPLTPEMEMRKHIAQNGFKCFSCEATIDPAVVQNTLQLVINFSPLFSPDIDFTLAARHAVSKYYQGWLVCDDPSTDLRTRQQSVNGRSWVQNGRRVQQVTLSKLRPEYPAKELYNQLKYIEHLVDYRKAEEAVDVEIKQREELKRPKLTKQSLSLDEKMMMDNSREVVRENFIKHSAYSWVKPSLFHHAFRLSAAQSK